MKAFSEGYRTEIRRSLLKYYGEENPAGDQEEYLKKLDYQEYAAADRIQLLEVLISRGLYSQAMSVIEESGYEGIRPESLLRLTSRMLTKCEMAEDEELLALASDVYRMGKYDEVILKYLMDYRFGPLDELLSVLKSAHGFDMDTYELEEKLLGLLMFTSDYRKEGEKILEDYVKHAGKEYLIGAYLTQMLMACLCGNIL